MRTQPAAVRRSIGVTGQDASLDEALTGRQNLLMIGQLSGLERAAAKARAAELLRQFELADAADRVVKGYSGGMRRRLDLAGSLVMRPPVLFLDEPTTGLDPTSRQRVWGIVRALVADGATVLLTTQYLDEADALADQIVVIDHGRVIASGTPRELKDTTGSLLLDVTLAEPHADAAPALAALRHRRRERVRRRPPAARHGAQRAGLAMAVLRALDAARRAGRRHRDPPPVAGRRVRRPHRSATAAESKADVEGVRGDERHRGTTGDRPPGPLRRGCFARLLAWAGSDVWVLTWRNLMHVRREPAQLSDVTIQPVLFTLLFVYVFGSAMVLPGGGSYKQFAVAGLLVMNLTTSTVGTAIGLSTDMSTGVIDRLRTLPMSPRRPFSWDARCRICWPRRCAAASCCSPGWPSAGAPTPRRCLCWPVSVWRCCSATRSPG